MPAGNGIGSVGGGGPIGMSSTLSTRRSPATAVWVWSRTSVNSAIGSRKRYVRKTKPINAPAVSPPSGPRTTPTVTTAAMVSTEKTSPDGKRKRADDAGSNLCVGPSVDGDAFVRLGARPACRPGWSRPGHDLGDADSMSAFRARARS